MAGGAVATYTAQAEETTAPALESQATTNHDVLANSEAAVLSAAPVSETVASEGWATASEVAAASDWATNAAASEDATACAAASDSAIAWDWATDAAVEAATASAVDLAETSDVFHLVL